MAANRSLVRLAILAWAGLAAGSTTLARERPDAAEALVGAWVVEAEGAPFRQHFFVYHADRTMLQTNPPAGNRSTSDSNGIGVWRHVRGNEFEGKFLEHNADHTTGEFLTQLTVTYRLKVDGDRFTGTAEAVYRDPKGVQVRGPLPATLTGRRITLP